MYYEERDYLEFVCRNGRFMRETDKYQDEQQKIFDAYMEWYQTEGYLLDKKKSHKLKKNKQGIVLDF